MPHPRRGRPDGRTRRAHGGPRLTLGGTRGIGPSAAALDAVAAALGPRCQRHVPIGPRTTYRVGGAAALFFEAQNVADLLAIAPAVQGHDVPVVVLGRGSNLLVADAGFPGLVVTLAGPRFGAIGLPSGTRGAAAGVDALGSADEAGRDGWEGFEDRGALDSGAGVAGGEGIHEEGIQEDRSGDPRYRVRAGGAVALPVLARQTAAAGLTGLEWAVGVPGSVGGAVRMNAGGHGADTRATLRRCSLVELRRGTRLMRSVDELGLGYRRSSVTPDQVVVEAEYQLAPGDREVSEATIRDIARWRREHQPGGQNAGSVFVNPTGAPPANSAGWLVDAAGLKGHRHGTASVSTKHANFILADPDGSADDVVALMAEVQGLVSRRLGVVLHPEVRLLGFPEHLTSTLGLGPSGPGDSRQLDRDT